MTNHDKDVLHVINEYGNKLTISFSEHVEGNYQIDDEWYRIHGYFSKEGHRAHINYKSFSNGKQN